MASLLPVFIPNARSHGKDNAPCQDGCCATPCRQPGHVQPNHPFALPFLSKIVRCITYGHDHHTISGFSPIDATSDCVSDSFLFAQLDLGRSHLFLARGLYQLLHLVLALLRLALALKGPEVSRTLLQVRRSLACALLAHELPDPLLVADVWVVVGNAVQDGRALNLPFRGHRGLDARCSGTGFCDCLDGAHFALFRLAVHQSRLERLHALLRRSRAPVVTKFAVPGNLLVDALEEVQAEVRDKVLEVFRAGRVPVPVDCTSAAHPVPQPLHTCILAGSELCPARSVVAASNVSLVE